MQKYYQPEHERFACLDNSLLIDYERVNDDYCDCPDGSDEPGTSACHNGEFCCRNAGYRSSTISSRVVNDGICDCCDGSDEQNLVCNNTCKIFYDAEVSLLMVEINKIENAKHNCTMYMKNRELNKYSADFIKQIDEQIDHLHQEIKKTDQLLQLKEEDYVVKLSKHEETMKGIQDTVNAEFIKKKIGDYFSLIDLDRDEKLSMVECLLLHHNIVRELGNHENIDMEIFWNVLMHENNLETMEKEIKERRIFKTQLKSKPDDDGKKHTFPGWDSPFENKESPNEEIGSYDPEMNDIEPDDLHTDEFVSSEILKFLHNQLKVIANREIPKSQVPEEVTKLMQEKERLQSIVNDYRNRIAHLEMHLNDINTYQKEDFGPDRVFTMLYDTCYNYESENSNYEVCPFRKILRNSSTNVVHLIGTYVRWDSEKPAYSTLIFENGSTCENGEKLKASLHLECDNKNEIVNVQDNHDCSFTFEMLTEAACYVKSTPKLDDSLYNDEL